MRPCEGLRNFVSRLKQVVLPAPLGPMRAWMDRRLTRKLISLTATSPPNSLVRPSVSRMISSLMRDNPLTQLCQGFGADVQTAIGRRAETGPPQPARL